MIFMVSDIYTEDCLYNISQLLINILSSNLFFYQAIFLSLYSRYNWT